jgi:hypothetical protein
LGFIKAGRILSEGPLSPEKDATPWNYLFECFMFTDIIDILGCVLK